MTRQTGRTEPRPENMATFGNPVFTIEVVGRHWWISVGVRKDDYNQVWLKQMFWSQ